MLQNIPKEKILEVVRQGPTIPQKIVKIVGGDTMLIGAILSTMISTGEVKYTVLKIGGSPMYYVPEHESKLEEYMNYLNEKDQKTARLLKEQKILYEASQDSLTKVSLKTIKDFAKPFVLDNQLFYRYFLISKDEAEMLAKEFLKKIKEDESEKIRVKEEELNRAKEKEEALQIAMQKREAKETKENIKAINTQDVHEEKVSIMAQTHSEHENRSVEHKDHTKKENTKENAPKKEETETESEELSKKDSKDFFERIKEHVHKSNLDIISKEKIKKSEYTLILKNHDSNEYIYCVAKDKKSVNEGDLSTAFVFAHQKKMPCTFLITGKLTKKAESMTQKEFKDMKIEQIE